MRIQPRGRSGVVPPAGFEPAAHGLGIRPWAWRSVSASAVLLLPAQVAGGVRGVWCCLVAAECVVLCASSVPGCNWSRSVSLRPPIVPSDAGLERTNARGRPWRVARVLPAA